MVLEDFFTLSEMKDGLANIIRVEELISIMESQKDSIRSIVGDAARQWSTVGNIIAATERKDCLDHFIQLNGLSYLNHWLEEAQKQKSEDGGSSSTEELVNATLGALVRLPADQDASSASGIGLTMKQLHGSSWGNEKIQERVNTLTLKWSFSEDDDAMNCQPANGEGTVCEDGMKSLTSSSSSSSSSSLPKTDMEEDNVGQPADPALDKGEANAVGESMENMKSSDQVADEDRLSEEINAQSSHAVVTPGPEGLVPGNPEPIPATEALPSVSLCPAIKDSERRDDEDEPIPDESCRQDDASDGGVEDMDIEIKTKESSSGESSPKNVPFVSPEILTGSRRSADGHSVVRELKQERSEIALEYGEIDALEVARQVAIEVEREVVDYREPFCSSSPEVAASGGEMVQSAAAQPDGKKDDVDNDDDDVDDDDDEDNNEDDDDDDANCDEKESSSKDSAGNSDDVHVVEESTVADLVKSPKSTSLVHELTGDVEKRRCDFDLNEDVCSEEDDHPMAPVGALATTSLSAPVAVAASKGAAAMPGVPLHFEGELGWRGSAATSAFRPASVSGQRQKAAVITIDLNIADGEDEVVVGNDLEMCSRPDRLKLDLNRSDDDDLLLGQTSFWRPLPQNEINRCTSPSSSSSSRQPSHRDFDLNDDLSAIDACGSSSSLLSRPAAREPPAAFRSYKFEDPAVMIMGSRLGVDRRELPQRSMPYPHMPPPPHGFSYNPAMSLLPPSLYGPGSMPYMVDTSGATVVPQILSSAGVAPGSAATRPPFLMGVVGSPPLGLNMVGGSSRLGLDLNSGGVAGHGEGGSREMGSFRHAQQNVSGFVEDRVLKRKEPDWEPPYSFGCKQATSWQ